MLGGIGVAHQGVTATNANVTKDGYCSDIQTVYVHVDKKVALSETVKFHLKLKEVRYKKEIGTRGTKNLGGSLCSVKCVYHHDLLTYISIMLYTFKIKQDSRLSHINTLTEETAHPTVYLHLSEP